MDPFPVEGNLHGICEIWPAVPEKKQGEASDEDPAQNPEKMSCSHESTVVEPECPVVRGL